MTPMPSPTWVRSAMLYRVIDADTIVCQLDQGCRDAHYPVMRLAGINAPERYTVAGKAAIKAVSDWMAIAYQKAPTAYLSWPLVVETQKDEEDKYGRWLATIWRRSDGSCLNEYLIAEGFAVAWDGQGKKPV